MGRLGLRLGTGSGLGSKVVGLVFWAVFDDFCSIILEAFVARYARLGRGNNKLCEVDRGPRLTTAPEVRSDDQRPNG